MLGCHYYDANTIILVAQVENAHEFFGESKTKGVSPAHAVN